MTTLVMKFGGSAVGTVSALTQVLSIILHESKRWDRLLLVASALEGVTDNLLEAAHLAQVANQRGYRRIAATLRTRHLALSEQLPLDSQERSILNADIDRLLFEMIDDCQSIANTPSESLSPEISDRIVGVGEKLAARIIASLLRNNHLRGVAIDGTDVIVTNHVHGNASPLFDETQNRIDENLLPMLEHQIIPVVTGFIGSTVDGIPTTLGRGGSDYSASVLASCMNADELWIWSDVDGMMSSDPQEINTATVISKMSYNEVAELAYFGARILHTRMIYPLQERRIPLRIKNVYKPQELGTLIHDSVSKISERIIAVTAISGISLIASTSGSLSHILDVVDETFLEVIGNKPDVMISSQSSIQSFLCFIVPTSAGGIEAVNTIRDSLQTKISQFSEDTRWHVEHVSVISVIGENLDNNLALTSRILQAVSGIRLIGMTQGPSRCSFSLVVQPDDAHTILTKIHSLITQ